MKRKFFISIVLMVTLIASMSIQVSFASDDPGQQTGQQTEDNSSTDPAVGNNSDTGAAPATFDTIIPKITVSTKEDYTRIKWRKINDAKYYYVYRASSRKGKYKRLKKVKVCHFNDKKANSGKVYYYKMRARRRDGTFTKYSEPKKFRTVSRVYVACGHGRNIWMRWDYGCSYKGMHEAKLMLPIVKDMVKFLRSAGVYVYTDADVDNKMNMNMTVGIANRKRISAYVSVHCDWYRAPSGTLPLYMSSAGKKLAIALNEGVHNRVYIKHRSYSYRPELYELRVTKVPACIFETGSIKRDYKIFKKKHKKYGKGLAEGLCNYLDVDVPTP